MSTSSIRVAALDADGDLSGLPDLLEARGWQPAETLLVFDFDLTLSHLPVIRTPSGKLARSIRAELRGGDATLAALRSLHEAGARFAILTAKVDAGPGVEAVAAKLAHLGLAPFFNASRDAQAEARLATAAGAAQLRCASRGDLLGSGHNKPEVFWLWADAAELADRTRLVYIEDCADHVLNFHQALDLPKCGVEDALLLWWPPPHVPGFETAEVHALDAIERLRNLIAAVDKDKDAANRDCSTNEEQEETTNETESKNTDDQR